MKRYALFHTEEELYLNDYEDGYDLDTDLYLFTKGELEYIFTNQYDVDDFDLETVKTIDGTVYDKSEFELEIFELKEIERINFNEFKFE